jgi:uncharacterized protein DUF4389
VGEDRLRVTTDEALRRRRLAVLFRSLLLIPHYVVLSLWSFFVVLILLIGWFAALITGRLPARLHRWLTAYLRYWGHVTAWFELLSGRYPLPHQGDRHPFAIEIPRPGRQRRIVTALRLPLALPAIVLTSVFIVILTTSAVGAWFVALILGRTTAGLQELGTYCLRYQLETSAYLMLLTPRYPRLEPAPPPAEQLLIPGL